MHLFFIRHGESLVNYNVRPWTQWDEGLTPLGKQQASLLAAWVRKHLAPCALYSSTLARSIETADYLGKFLDLQIQFNDCLREVGTCTSDGHPISPSSEPVKLLDYQPSIRPREAVGPGRECWEDFVERVEKFVTEILSKHRIGEQILVVCHSGTIEAISDYALGVKCPRNAELSIFHTGVTYWEMRDYNMPEPWLLHGHNMVYHLYENSTGNKFFSGAACHWQRY